MKKRILSVLLAAMLAAQTVPISARANCSHHTHNDTCGYRESAAGADCTHSHDDSCYAAECTHVACSESCVHDETTGLCLHVCGDECKVLKCSHQHGDCGYIAPVEAQNCSFDPATCPDCAQEQAAAESVARVKSVQDLLDALPGADAITLKNRDDVIAQLEAIDEAKATLVGSEPDQLDGSKYQAAVDKLALIQNEKPNEPDPGEESGISFATKKVAYVNASGEIQPEVSAFVLTGDIPQSTRLTDGNWYVVEGTATASQYMHFEGNVNLILGDDSSLTITNCFSAEGTGHHLTIWGQTKGSGSLTVNAGPWEAGIQLEGASLTIHGGIITATGGTGGERNGAGIGGGGGMSHGGFTDITIHGGTVVATGQTNVGIGNGSGNITVTGGTVTATGANGVGLDTSGTITISGGSFPQGISLGSGKKLRDVLATDCGFFENDQLVSADLNSSSFSGSFTVSKASLSGVSVAQNGELTYTGSAQTASVTAEPQTYEGETVTYTYSTEPNGPYDTAVPAFTNAGTHTVYYKALAPGHGIATGSFTVTIAPKALAITGATLASKDYDGTTQAVVESVTFDGSDSLSLGSSYTATAVFEDANAGTAKPATITVTLSDPNYILPQNTCSATGTINQVAPQPLTATASVVYADAAEKTISLADLLKDPTYIGVPSYAVSVAENEILNGTPVVENGVLKYKIKNQKTNIGKSIDIPVTVTGLTNYRSLTITVTVTVTDRQSQENLAITAPGTKTYGDAAFTLATTGGSSTGTVTFTSSHPDILSISGNTATIKKAGTVTITATQAADAAYKETTATYALTIGKKALTVKADDIQITRGSQQPTFTYTVTGLAQGDTFTNPTITTTAVDTNTLGTFPIQIQNGSLSNQDSYLVTYENGTLTVAQKLAQAALTITAPGTKTYGDSAFTLAATGGSGTGAVSFTSSDPSILFISGTTATIKKAGIVTITATKASDSAYQAATATYVLTIEKRALTVKADNIQVTIGSQKPALTYTVVGLVKGDTVTNPTLSTQSTHTLGKFDIQIKNGTLTNKESYQVTYQTGTMTVIPKEYTITKGADQTVSRGKSASFTSNASYTLFEDVKVDGKILDSKHYDTKSGSTIVILKASYIETLSSGWHSLTILSEDGSADTGFYLKRSSSFLNDSDNPRTGDFSNVGIWLTMAGISAAGILAALLDQKRQKNRIG